MSEVFGGAFDGSFHRLPIRVYYEDTDFSGVVYYANYLKFCERGRTEFLRALGIHHAELHGNDLQGRTAFAVRRFEGEFLKPAGIDDLLTVETRLAELRGASIRMAQQVLRGDAALFRLTVQIAVIDGRQRPARISDDMRALLSPILATNNSA